MSSVRRFDRLGNCRADQKRLIKNQRQDSTRQSLSIQRYQRDQREEQFWNSNMNRHDNRHAKRPTSSTNRYSRRSYESWRSSEARAMTFSDQSRRNELEDYGKRLESTYWKTNSPRYRSRSRELRPASRGRDRGRKSPESWTRNSRSISRERFLSLRRYWSKSRSRSTSGNRSVVQHSPRSHKMVNFERSVSKGPDPRPRSESRQKSPAPKRSRSPAKPLESPTEVRVGNLTTNVTKGHLIEIFSRFGGVNKVDLDQSRREEPRAFIQFYNKADAEYAINTMNEGEIDGKLIEVTLVGGSPRKRDTSPKIIFRHRTPPPMPHEMMIKTGQLVNQHRFVDPVRDKLELIPCGANHKRKY